MARKQSTGTLRLWWVPTVANNAAPTVAEINAGVDLTPFLKRDGLSTPLGGETSDASNVASLYNAQSPGTYGGDPVGLGLYRDSVTGSDTAYSTLVPQSADTPNGTVGKLVVRRFGGSTVAPAAGQKVEVWPAEVLDRAHADIAENENQWFTARLAIPSEPSLNATVAA